MDNKELIGRRINTLLAERQLKQKDLAKELGVTDNTISYFTKGVRIPNLDQIIKIAKYFDVSTDYLLGITDVSTTDADIQKISQDLGLNEYSIALLRRLKEHPHNEYTFSNFVNDLLKKLDCHSIWLSVRRYKSLSQKEIYKHACELTEDDPLLGTNIKIDAEQLLLGDLDFEMYQKKIIDMTNEQIKRDEQLLLEGYVKIPLKDVDEYFRQKIVKEFSDFLVRIMQEDS